MPWIEQPRSLPITAVRPCSFVSPGPSTRRRSWGSDIESRALIQALPIADDFVPIVGNHAGQIISTPEQLRQELCAQYVRPVEWQAALKTLYSEVCDDTSRWVREM